MALALQSIPMRNEQVPYKCGVHKPLFFPHAASNSIPYHCPDAKSTVLHVRAVAVVFVRGGGGETGKMVKKRKKRKEQSTTQSTTCELRAQKSDAPCVTIIQCVSSTPFSRRAAKFWVFFLPLSFFYTSFLHLTRAHFSCQHGSARLSFTGILHRECTAWPERPQVRGHNRFPRRTPQLRHELLSRTPSSPATPPTYLVAYNQHHRTTKRRCQKCRDLEVVTSSSAVVLYLLLPSRQQTGNI